MSRQRSFGPKAADGRRPMMRTFRYSGNQAEADGYIGADGKPGDPIISRYSGQTCDIVRPLTDDERDPEVGTMYLVRFADGYEGDVFPDELED